MKNNVVLIDGSGVLFRSFYAFRNVFYTTEEGQKAHIGGVFGSLLFLLNLMEKFKPKSVIVAMDGPKRTFRKEKYPDYKSNRTECPDDLIPQFKLLEDGIEALGLTWERVDGYEADDVIATHTRIAKEAGQQCTVVSTDKDLMQLIDDVNVNFYHASEKRFLFKKDVVSKFGIEPAKLIEYFALLGDSSDNIPGVKLIGKKTAENIIKKFGSIEELYKHINVLQNESVGSENNKMKAYEFPLTAKIVQTLQEEKHNAMLSRDLIELCTSVPLNKNKQGIQTKINIKTATEFLQKYQMKGLQTRIKNITKDTLIESNNEHSITDLKEAKQQINFDF